MNTFKGDRMKQGLMALSVAAGAALCGCESSGLSPREVPGRTQSSYLYSMYEGLGSVEQSGPTRPLQLPANVAVVQVGEVTPPATKMDAMKKDKAVFARVEPFPGPDSPQTAYDAKARQTPTRPSITTLRRAAADAGMDYVLLVGGTIDHDTSGTPLSLLDVTIVGGFIVPSRESRATAKASAALVDVKSGRVMVSSSAEAKKWSLVPAASVDGEQPKLLEAVRDDVVAKLGTQVVADVKARAEQTVVDKANVRGI
jgi:hypothetical protein